MYEIELQARNVQLALSSSTGRHSSICDGSFCFRPRGGIGSEQPPSSDSDDYGAAHHQGAAGYGQNLDVYTVPKVQVSGPSNADESASVING